MTDKQQPLSQRIAFGMLNICLLVIILYYGKDLFVPAFFAVLFSLLLLVPCRLLERIMPRSLAAFLTVAIVVLLVSLLLTMLARQFSSFAGESPKLMDKVNHLIYGVRQFFRQHFGIQLFGTQKDGAQGISQIVGPGSGWITSTLFLTTGVLVRIGLVTVYVFFFLLYRQSFVDFIFHIFRNQEEASLRRIINRLQKLIQSYIIGILTVIVIIAALNSAGLFILKIDNALLLGTIAACFAVIPYIGVFAGALLPLLVAFVTKDSPWYAVGVACLAVIVHLLEGNVITPYFVGRRVRINPLTAILGMFAGDLIWGLPGIVLAIPTLAVVKSVFDSVPSLTPFGFMLGLEISDGKSTLKDLLHRIKFHKSSGLKHETT